MKKHKKKGEEKDDKMLIVAMVTGAFTLGLLVEKIAIFGIGCIFTTM